MEQRDLGEHYQSLTTSSARKAFVKEYATQYTQLAHLPYFNLVEQIVIDPMHNLFLGKPSYYHLEDVILYFFRSCQDPLL